MTLNTSTVGSSVMMTAWIYIFVVVTNLANIMVVPKVMSNMHPSPVFLQANDLFNIACLVISIAWIYCLKKNVTLWQYCYSNNGHSMMCQWLLEARGWSICVIICSGILTFLHFFAIIWTLLSLWTHSDLQTSDKIYSVLAICLNGICLLISGTIGFYHLKSVVLSGALPKNVAVHNHFHNHSEKKVAVTTAPANTASSAPVPTTASDTDANVKYEEEIEALNKRREALKKQMENLMKKREEELKRREKTSSKKQKKQKSSNEHDKKKSSKKPSVGFKPNGDIVSDDSDSEDDDLANNNLSDVDNDDDQ